MKVETAIEKAKMKLRAKTCRGIYENFGQREVRELQAQYLTEYNNQYKHNYELISKFEWWCMNFTKGDLE